MIKIQKFKNLLHLLEAIIANFLYGFPSRKLKVIGITGTDGKTTTTHLIYHILKSVGKKVSMVSTVYAKVGNEEFDTGLHTTTPRSFLVQKLLRLAVSHADEYFILETTSHAIDQNRVWGVKYYVSVLTNMTHEHLDYHQTYEEYLKTKAGLLLSSKISIVNKDDQSFNRLNRILTKSGKIFKTYSQKKGVDYSWDRKIKTKLEGKMNKYNILAAYSVVRELNIPTEIVLKAIADFRPPLGRMDLIYDKDFKVIIDFAHTPNAIAQALKAVREEILTDKKGRIIHVFGSAGLRDSSKRPLMGQASAKFSNIIILTEEDYRTEDVNDIILQIERGIDRKSVYKIQNRQEAINKAVTIAKEGDIVIITGKGHEKSLCRGKTEYPWDEYKAVAQALQLKFKL